MEKDSDEPLTPAEVARMAGVTAAAVRVWANQGRLPVRRTPSGVRFFRRIDVEHHLADRARHGRSAGRRR